MCVLGQPNIMHSKRYPQKFTQSDLTMDNISI